jgi:two-component system chemotaxis response regulator CheY
MARILVIDDDDQFRELLTQVLEAAGHVVLQSDNGIAAISMLRGNLPDVVLTDLVMPDQDGLGVIMMIRKEMPMTPVIAMSGGTTRVLLYLEIARKLGAKQVLEKPFSPDRLFWALNNVLECRGRESDA